MHYLVIKADVTQTVTAIIYIRVFNVTATERVASPMMLHIFLSTSRRAKEVRSRNRPQEPPAQTRPVWSPSSRLLCPASCPSGRLRLRPDIQRLVCVQQPVKWQQPERSLSTLSVWVTHFCIRINIWKFLLLHLQLGLQRASDKNVPDIRQCSVWLTGYSTLMFHMYFTYFSTSKLWMPVLSSVTIVTAARFVSFFIHLSQVGTESCCTAEVLMKKSSSLHCLFSACKLQYFIWIKSRCSLPS